jgi:Uma2 family endonuclease
MSAFPLEREIEYPTTDGHLMAESIEHQQVMIDLILGFRQRYAARSDVWVAGNFILCYEKGNPRAFVAPDVMLAIGVRKRRRENYLLWEEGKPPDLLVEVTSKSTRREDEVKKKALYERIGVEEYLLFDPKDEYLKPRLQGFRLARGLFRPIRLERDGALLSRTTGLTFLPEGERLRLLDTASGEPMPWSEELGAARQDAEAGRRAAEAARQAAEARAAEEAAARRAAEERVRILEEELNHLRKGGNG